MNRQVEQVTGNQDKYDFGRQQVLIAPQRNSNITLPRHTTIQLLHSDWVEIEISELLINRLDYLMVVLPTGLAVVVPTQVYAFDRLVVRRTFKFREIKLSDR